MSAFFMNAGGPESSDFDDENTQDPTSEGSKLDETEDETETTEELNRAA